MYHFCYVLHAYHSIRGYFQIIGCILLCICKCTFFGVKIQKLITVDMVILACSNFHEFLILGLFTKCRTHKFSFSSAIKRIIFARFLNSRICPSCKITEKENLMNITRSTVFCPMQLGSLGTELSHIS